MKKWYVIRAVKAMVFIPLAVLLFGYVVMHLWNWLVPELFHGPVIGFCQALGLLILGKLFFGGFRGGWCGGGRCGARGYWGRGHWRARFEEKMSKMTPEEKEKFKQEFSRCCGGSDWCKTDEPTSDKRD